MSNLTKSQAVLLLPDETDCMSRQAPCLLLKRHSETPCETMCSNTKTGHVSSHSNMLFPLLFPSLPFISFSAFRSLRRSRPLRRTSGGTSPCPAPARFRPSAPKTSPSCRSSTRSWRCGSGTPSRRGRCKKTYFRNLFRKP